MWGSSAPTVKAIKLRVCALKKLAREQDNSGVPTTSPQTPKRKGGLLTPQSSPKSSSKRPFTPDDESFTARRVPKRRAKQNIKYSDWEIMDSSEEGPEEAKNMDDSSEEDDNWTPEENVVGDDNGMKIKSEVEMEKEDHISEKEGVLGSPFVEKKGVAEIEPVM